MTVDSENQDGSKIVDVIVKTANSETIKRGVFANGILNYADTVGVSGANQSLSPKIRKNPNILVDFTAHSKGTAITANAILDIINSGDGAILKGKKIRFNSIGKKSPTSIGSAMNCLFIF